MKTTFLPWIEKYWDKLDWSSLSSNHNAISILENNLDKIDCNQVSDVQLV